MGLSVATITRKVSDFELAGIPLGKAGLAEVGLGVADVVKALVATKAPDIPYKDVAVGAGLAWALSTKQAKKLIGADLAELLAIVVLADAVDDELKVRDRVGDAIVKLFGWPGISRASPARRDITNAAATGNRLERDVAKVLDDFRGTV